MMLSLRVWRIRWDWIRGFWGLIFIGFVWIWGRYVILLCCSVFGLFCVGFRKSGSLLYSGIYTRIFMYLLANFYEIFFHFEPYSLYYLNKISSYSSVQLVSDPFSSNTRKFVYLYLHCFGVLGFKGYFLLRCFEITNHLFLISDDPITLNTCSC